MAARKKQTRKKAGKKPKLRPIQELIRKICKDDHTKGIIVW